MEPNQHEARHFLEHLFYNIQKNTDESVAGISFCLRGQEKGVYKRGSSFFFFLLVIIHGGC